ncbi:MAG TPA: ribosome-associated translation inhibitor RaiA [Candidatus Dormibacteraeota bacterium]|nr:ribosome-associated translation inhibitor RaiA [Candidatus Dormibacteraeota bacterium]
MRVLVHDRTDGLSNQLVSYAQSRLSRLSRHFDRIVDVEVDFERESRRGSNPDCSVWITVHTHGRRHPLAHASEKAADPRAALDLALDKVDRQVVKLKEKIKLERKRAAMTTPEDGESDDAELPELERIRLKLQPESLAEAEAALESSRHPCYVFLDETSGMVNVCFRRPDGGLTVIEPVVK